MATNGSHAATSNKLFVTIWIWLLILTVLEVAFAYLQMALAMMLVILMGLSVVKAALIMAYFMHLKFERMSLVLTLIPALVILICLMFISFPDSVRIQQLVPR